MFFEAAADDGKAQLFIQVHFHIILSKDLDEDDARRFTTSLLENGATEHASPSADGKIPIEGLTHLITTTIDFENYDAMADRMISTVLPDWIEVSIHKKKLANPKSHSPDPRRYFSGCVITCADLPLNDKNAIIGGVLAMGGLYSKDLTKLVTHVVALSDQADMCKVVRARDLRCKIVLSHWFDDCLRLGKRIDEAPYLFPDPEIFRQRGGSDIRDAPRPDLHGATSPFVTDLPLTPAGSPSPHRRNLSVFKVRRVMIDKDMGIASHLVSTIEDVVRSSEGIITQNVETCDMYICQYREGDDYVRASKLGKDVGNLTWLYELITTNTWTSPYRRLLHYPIVRTGLPGFSQYRISLSNYNGEARLYLENLAKAAGCEFTKTMKQDNTHLITAHLFSDKCDAAEEWNVHRVNHLWLEESYAKWEEQSVTRQRYTHFPPRTNLGEVVGQTPIDRDVLRAKFFPEELDESLSIPPEKPANVNAAMDRADMLMNILIEDPTEVPDAIVNLEDEPTAGTPSVAPAVSPPKVLYKGTPKLAKTPRGAGKDLTIRTPAVSRSAEDKENQTPSTTGSRGAKDRAKEKLHDLAPDIALYEKEKKRVGGVIFGGRKSTGEKDQEGSTEKKRAVSATTLETESDDSRAAKRSKKTKPHTTMNLLLSGYEAWVGDVKAEQAARAKLKELGVIVVQDPSKCTHLAAPRILRTPKFLNAIAYAPVVLSTDFVDACLEKDELQDPDEFILIDAAGEANYGLNLREVVDRAETNKQGLLKNYGIFCTENVRGGWEPYKQIIENNGGSCLLYKGRAGAVQAALKGLKDTDPSSHPEHMYLVSSAEAKDSRLWLKFRQGVEALGKTPRIVRNDWLLDVALTQEMRWKEEYLLEEEEH